MDPSMYRVDLLLGILSLESSASIMRCVPPPRAARECADGNNAGPTKKAGAGAGCTNSWKGGNDK